MNEQENVVSITLTNVEYQNATISISQTDAIEYLAQNVAVSVINLVLPQLYPNLLSAVTSNSSNNNNNSNNGTTSSTNSISKRTRSIIIGFSVGFVVLLFIVIIILIKSK